MIERSDRQRQQMQDERERRREQRERQSGSRRPEPREEKSRFDLSKRSLWLIGVGCLILIWILSGFMVRAFNSGEVLGGTSMDGIELGGMTRVEATDAITAMDPRTIELSGQSQTIELRAPQAGLEVDVRQSTNEAFDAGRTGFLPVLLGPLSMSGTRELDPVYKPVNSKRLNRTVNRIADRLDREPFVGALEIDPSSLEVSTDQPEAGIAVRREPMKDQLVEAIKAGESTMKIPVRKQPAPTPAQVESVAQAAERYLEQPLTIRTAGGAAEFDPNQVAEVLAIESTDDGIELGADKEAVESLIAEFAQGRDIQPRDAGLDTPSSPPVTLSKKGDLSWQPRDGVASITRARTGRLIRQKQAVNKTIRAIKRDRHQVGFPTEIVKPSVGAGTLRNATSLLGTFTTFYPCCEPRVTNIQQMAKTVDGTVVGPGEQFSLNSVAGERTKANGYKDAPTIGEGNKLVDSVGGGVSQFSTTLYNAAYFAGLQIDSHTPHSFYIDRYPPGRESTLNYGSIDLLWTNDTDAPVVVRSSADDTSVTVSIYGGNGGRRVKAETQSRSGNSQGGFDITIDRVIVQPDGSRDREPFTTVYGVPAE